MEFSFSQLDYRGPRLTFECLSWGPTNGFHPSHHVPTWAYRPTAPFLNSRREDPFWRGQILEEQYLRHLPHRSSHEATNPFSGSGNGAADYSRRPCERPRLPRLYAYSLERDLPTDRLYELHTRIIPTTPGDYAAEAQNEGHGIGQHSIPSPEHRCKSIHSGSSSPSPSSSPVLKGPIFNNTFPFSSPPASPQPTHSRTSSGVSPCTPSAPRGNTGARSSNRERKRLTLEERRLRRWQTVLEVRERLLRAKERELEEWGSRRAEWNERRWAEDHNGDWRDLGILDSD